MKIETFEVGPFFENTYLLMKEGKALLIDPGFSTSGEFEHFLAILETSGSQLSAVLLTHAHVDHVLGLHKTLKQFQIPVYLNTCDLFLWENFGNQATMFGLNEVGFSFTPLALPSAGKMEIAGFEFECLYTPGHSPDHTSFYFKEEGVCLAGDALFKESVGRTDLYKGDFSILEASIKDKLYNLPNNTIIYPGHGAPTTIGHEKQYNPFVKA